MIEAILATPGPKLTQFMRAMRAVPVPISDDAIVISDNADIYGTLTETYVHERTNHGCS